MNGRQTFRRTAPRVRAHVCLCMLAYHVEWHLRQRLAPMLYDDTDLQSSKQLTASSPRLRSEPCVQLLSDLRERVRSPAAPLLFRFGQRSRPHLAVFPCNAEARQEL